MAHARWSDAVENRSLDLLLGSSHDTTATPATVYVGLVKTAPSDANGTGLVESTYTNYARVSVANNDTNWPAASGRSKSNGTAITFAACGATGDTIVGFAIYTAASAGTFLAYGDLTASQAVTTGVTPQFAIGQLSISSPST